MKFIDLAYFVVKSGDGGKGCVSFRHELYVDKGGPNGGDGGKGGSVFFVGDEGKTSLLDLKIKRKYTAPNGENGMIKNMHGKNAEDIYIKVPVGTIIYNNKTNQVIADFIKHQQTELIAAGGKGGRGNARFASSRNKAPRIFEAGDKGAEIEIKAELKVLADVGFVGFPNAGKSTLLRSISNSRPEVADYPFTTLTPQLGVCADSNGRHFVCADLPGLIEGASLGKGLGFSFLRHIERCRIICHIIDMSGNYGQEDVIENYQKIRTELVTYNLNLENKIEIIVANKMDIEGADETLVKFQAKYHDKKIISVSGLKKQNINKLLLEIGEQLELIKLEEEKIKTQNAMVNGPNERYYGFTPTTIDIKVRNLGNHHWQVSGEDVLKVYDKTPLSTFDNLLVFNEKMKKLGVYDILREKGALNGDMIHIFDIELE